MQVINGDNGDSGSSTTISPLQQPQHSRTRSKNFGIPVKEYSDKANFALDNRLKEMFAEFRPGDQRLLLELSDEDKELVADFIDAWLTWGKALKMPKNTKKKYVTSLVYLSNWTSRLIKIFKVENYLEKLF
jgi:hypothetical protein